MEAIEFIKADDKTLAIIIRAGFEPQRTTFITPESFEQQVGFIVYPTGGVIAPHKHKRIERHLDHTSETLVVRKGRLEVQLYDEAGAIVAERELVPGDILVLVSGGHGFRMREDTVILEIKQGPYTGLAEKEHLP